ncbi:phosphodiester glycosidase family protein [Sphingobacterium sp. ML3W]|uniref:phosphodiester glycosidase family protein n=1 Tax=Sphingobacterium sp. ML3W TaxID=1538644 RepID=UPI00249A10AB|nr:phosphodiester glycosidase family protein [Sphingobacterium sp. ML3W]WFA81089.1 phosphodiester glycosidase family protein [Sphingobacterium sp. ML3W]
MKIITSFILSLLLLFMLSCKEKIKNEDQFVIYQVSPDKGNVKLYWKNNDHTILRSIARLKKEVEARNETLLFAMNGGMFEPDNSPKGLYIDNFKMLKSIDTLKGNGNSYLPRNGIFYLTRNNQTVIVKTQKFRQSTEIRYATQSGPMLLMNGEINPIFQKDSKNLNIGNGVGILGNGDLLFVLPKEEISFYNLARFFKESGCKNALYLDGFVSRAYLPEKNWV